MTTLLTCSDLYSNSGPESHTSIYMCVFELFECMHAKRNITDIIMHTDLGWTILRKDLPKNVNANVSVHGHGHDHDHDRHDDHVSASVRLLQQR